MMKSLGAAAIAFLVPGLHVTLPEGVAGQSYQPTYWEAFFSSRDLLLRSWRPNDYPCFVRMAYVGRIAMRQSVQLVLFVSLTFFTGAAHAVDRGQFENVPDDVRTWFKGVRSPAGVPCCDISDGHPLAKGAGTSLTRHR